MTNDADSTLMVLGLETHKNCSAVIQEMTPEFITQKYMQSFILTRINGINFPPEISLIQSIQKMFSDVNIVKFRHFQDIADTGSKKITLSRGRQGHGFCLFG